MTTRICLFVLSLLVSGTALPWATGSRQALAAPITRVPVASGLTRPLHLISPPGDSSRLFVLEQPGRIRIVENDSLLPTPFLDIASRVESAGSEQGLLGLAFHPAYDANGYFYVNYTAEPDGRTVVSRFQVSGGNPNLALPDSEKIILEVAQPFSNHNGGMIAFGPNDGYLYIGLGDGGSAGDPGNRAQNPQELLGKMLRIDVDVDSTYAVPGDNPFVAPDTARHEIWAFGLRNPWRWSFDRQNGELYIADVGQNVREEIDWQAAGGGGENYGWRLKEATSCFNPSTNCDPAGVLIDPITEYLHSAGRCSITGGYVYRGCALPDLVGSYFYGDYCTGEIWSIRFDGNSITDSTDHTAAIGLGNFDLGAFGQDAQGELYIVGLSSGTVYKVVPDGVPDGCGGCPITQSGDVNVDQVLDATDVIYLVSFVFKAGPAPLPVPQAGDVNCDSMTTAADVIYLVNHVFKSGPAPCDICSIL